MTFAQYISLDEAKRKKGSGSGPVLDPRDPVPTARELVKIRFTHGEGQRLIYRHRGAFYVYAGNHYRQLGKEEIRAVVWGFLETARRTGRDGKIESFKPTRMRVGDVLDALAAVVSLDSTVAPPAWLEDDELRPASEFIAVGNGLLHLAAGTLHNPTPSFFNLSASGVVFDSLAPEPAQWLAFLNDLFGYDREAIEMLQDWFGYCLTADTRQQKILLIVGPKRSGKGTIAHVIANMIGKDNVAAPTLASLSLNFGLEPLIGKPLAIVSDARLGGRSDQAAISERLLSISGEDLLTIDRKYRCPWTGKLPTRFMLLTNELLGINDVSGALTGRFIVLVLEKSFYGREDPTLRERLLGELPGILNWSLIGYRRLRERGFFTQPASSKETIEALETLGSPITAFIRERCRVAPGLSVAVAVIYRTWQSWCAANGRKEPGTVQTFGRDLQAAYPSIKMARPRDGEDRVRTYVGVGLL